MSSLEWRKAYAKAHPEKGAAAQARWRAKNKEKHAENQRKRRARMRGAEITGTITLTDLVAAYGPVCLFPGCESTDLTVDHIKPLAKGGSHEWDNLQTLCRSHNCSKNSHHETDYRPVIANV